MDRTLTSQPDHVHARCEMAQFEDAACSLRRRCALASGIPKLDRSASMVSAHMQGARSLIEPNLRHFAEIRDGCGEGEDHIRADDLSVPGHARQRGPRMIDLVRIPAPAKANRCTAFRDHEIRGPVRVHAASRLHEENGVGADVIKACSSGDEETLRGARKRLRPAHLDHIRRHRHLAHRRCRRGALGKGKGGADDGRAQERDPFHAGKLHLPFIEGRS